MFKRGQYQLRKNNKNKTKTKKETDNKKGLFFYYFCTFAGCRSAKCADGLCYHDMKTFIWSFARVACLSRL